MPNISDVARLAGVSPKTVSRVLNNEPTVQASTRAKVLDAISALNYVPSQSARQMRTGQSNIIGLISDEIATTPYAVDIIKGAQAATWEFGKLLTVINTENDMSVEKRAFEMAREFRFDAMIYATFYHREVRLIEERREIPIVLLDCYDGTRQLTSVVPDEERGGYEATMALINRGHSCIGFINYSVPIPAMLGRLQGYQRALDESAIEFDPTLVVEENGHANGGYRGALELLQRDERPTALFCWNDRMAMGAYDAIKKLGLRIPDNVAVMGFDNQDIIAAQLHPALTTMQLPHYEMGQWAVRHLIRLISGTTSSSDVEPVQHKIACPLVARESV
jgi:LacI family transcriptional regulator